MSKAAIVKHYSRTCKGCQRSFVTDNHRLQYCPECRDLRYRISDEGILERDNHTCQICGHE